MTGRAADRSTIAHGRRTLAIRLLLLIGTLLTLATACSAAEQVTGIVTAVDGDLIEVRSFTIAISSDEVITLEPDADVDYAFPLVHLHEHRTSLIPVTVLYEERDGVLVLLAIGDAEGGDHRFGG